jgi:hypothetical protein
MKRFLSIILAVTMLIGLLPTLSFAVGDGTVVVDFANAKGINHDKYDTVAAVYGDNFTTVASETTVASGKYSARSFQAHFGVALIQVMTKSIPWLSDGGDREKWTIEVDFGDAEAGRYC